MKKHLVTILLFIILLVGLSLILYPTFSDWWNASRSSKVITEYSELVADLNEEDYTELWDAARLYNKSMSERMNMFSLNDQQKAEYRNLLNVGDMGIMSYIEIPSIDVSLPIYHGTDEGVLQVAVGHLDWSSLPVGGESTHCVVSGHRGLPSAKLFTNLDKLIVGDTFILRTLDEVLTYEVDQILIVEPNDVDALQIQKGKDLCTLVTCTPYGINTHRLLVRGHRIENTPEAVLVRVTANAVPLDPLVTASIVAVPTLLIAIAFLLTDGRSRRKSK